MLFMPWWIRSLVSIWPKICYIFARTPNISRFIAGCFWFEKIFGIFWIFGLKLRWNGMIECKLRFEFIEPNIESFDRLSSDWLHCISLAFPKKSFQWKRVFIMQFVFELLLPSRNENHWHSCGFFRWSFTKCRRIMWKKSKNLRDSKNRLFTFWTLAIIFSFVKQQQICRQHRNQKCPHHIAKQRSHNDKYPSIQMNKKNVAAARIKFN